ncbi:MAG: hypothetical protein Q8L90_02625 [Bacteroidota bacterium]|nr:hypothetical protein [Bacteroidota bacterium]
MKKWIYIIGLILCGQKLAAQNPCDNIIEEATDLYNAGRYEDCINMLENGLNTCSLSKNKKENAYVLLINSNIEKDSLPAVDKNFRLLLKNNPSFKIKEYTGLDDFSRKFNNYYVYPKLSFGIRPHYSIPKILSTGSYQLDVTPNIKNNNDFKSKRFFNTNLILEYRAIEKISFFADAGFFLVNYSRELELKDSLWKMTSTEESKYFQLGFGNKFYFLKSQKKFNFYLMGGFNNQYLRKSVLNIEQEKKQITNLYGDVDTKVESFEKKYTSDKLRNSYVVSVLLGTGITYRISNFGLGFDIRTYFSANTLNNKTARFKEPSLIQKYNYIDSDTRLLKSDFSLVFTYLLYKVKKKPIKN